MTRPIADLLTQAVLYDGYLYSWRTRQERKQVCLSTLTLRSYDTGRPIRQLDHAWVWVDDDVWTELVECHTMSGVEFRLKEAAQGAARVIRYWRKDGSYDYGLEQQGFLGTAALAKRRRRMDCRGRRRQRYRMMLAAADTEWLGQLMAALDALNIGIAQQSEDWRFFGRTPTDALANLRSQLQLTQDELAKRRRAQVEADAVMAIAASLGRSPVPLNSAKLKGKIG